MNQEFFSLFHIPFIFSKLQKKKCESFLDGKTRLNVDFRFSIENSPFLPVFRLGDVIYYPVGIVDANAVAHIFGQRLHFLGVLFYI